MSEQLDFLNHEQARSPIRQFEGRSQGAEANHKGKELEDHLVRLLQSYGAVPASPQKLDSALTDMFAERTVVRQYPYRRLVDGSRAYVDVLYVHGQRGPRVAFECKVQDETGSVDDKLYGAYLHAVHRWDFADSVAFVLSGDGFRGGWPEWLRGGGRKIIPNSKPIKVFTTLDSLRKPIRALVERGEWL